MDRIDTYRILLKIDGEIADVTLTDLPGEMGPIDTWTSMHGAIGEHGVEVELRRIT